MARAHRHVCTVCDRAFPCDAPVVLDDDLRYCENFPPALDGGPAFEICPACEREALAATDDDHDEDDDAAQWVAGAAR